MKFLMVAVALGAIGASAIFVLWILITDNDVDRALCFAAGGDRFISSQDDSCWRENGTRVWYK